MNANLNLGRFAMDAAAFKRGDYVTERSTGKVGKVVEVSSDGLRVLVRWNAGGQKELDSSELKTFEL